MKRNVILYIAVSLDGYIADDKGAVDWIKGHDEAGELDDTFTPFFNTVDTVIMGKRTYDQIVTELSPDQWPYMGVTTYVMTHHGELADTEHVRFRDTDVCGLVGELKAQSGGNIWICGGADIAGQLVSKDVIDVYHLAIIPVILGGGSRLFNAPSPTIDLRLTEIREYNGIVEVVYSKRRQF